MVKRILVVDDSATFRTIISVTLRQAGRDVEVACDGCEALELLESTAIDLFIVDVNMPRMGGIQFIKEMRKLERFAEAPIVILSAADDVDERDELALVKPLFWLEKGFSPAELEQKVSSILD